MFRWKVTMVAAAALAGVLHGFAAAADHPVDGLQLAWRGSNDKESLNVQLKDAAIPVPAPASPDSPAVTGLTLELFSHATGEVATYRALPGVGQHGWHVRATPSAVTYGYRNGTATQFGGDIQTVTLRTGAVAKVRSKAFGLTETFAHGAIGVRLSYGSERVCALFDGAAVRRDVPGLFVARNAEAGDLASCDDDVLLGECPPSGCVPEQKVFCGDGPVTAACSTALTTEAACAQEGGCWDVTPFHPSGLCNCPTLDADRRCTAPWDCESSLCIAPSSGVCESHDSGRCAATRAVYSCICFAWGEGGFYEKCID